MKLIKRLYTYGMIATLILAVGCTSSSVKEESSAVNQEVEGEQVSTNKDAAYKEKLFDTSYVHNINIEIAEEDWNDLLENASEQNFYTCNITIDGEEYSNVGIRTKGNSSLSQVVNSDSDRYSFKINFKKYDKEQNYYGLEKLNLNNIIQDATYMKDYLAYTMMGEFGVASPYVSYSYITINGEEWGLYLNVEEIEESFLERNYGEDYGNLYKPETMEMDGDKMLQGMVPERMPEGFDPENMMQMPQGENQGNLMQVPKASQAADTTKIPSESNTAQAPSTADAGNLPDLSQEATGNGMQGGQSPRGGFGGPGNENSLGADLKYTEDNYESYANIFDYAETDITDEDKDRLIASLKQLSEGQNLEEVLDVDALLRYFVVHNFVDNYDSYTGTMLHNYYLYEEDGKLTMLPWDYNLAFGAFGGMGGKNDKGNMLPPNNNVVQDNNATQNNNATQDNDVAQNTEANQNQDNVAPTEVQNGQMMRGGVDATSMVNMAIDTPLSGAEEEDRPMWSQLINNETYKVRYHELFDEFLQNYIENGVIQEEINRVAEMITPYVQKDPTAFYSYKAFTKGVETIKTFISLRGESIRKQLTGEIPSTTEEQNTFTGELVDASSINLSDMGSNNMGQEPGSIRGNGQEGMKQEEDSPVADTDAMTEPEASTQN